MNYYAKEHKYYCGIDLHGRTMYICIIDSTGDILHHKNYKSSRRNLLRALKPYREDVVVCTECMFAWFWVADVCADESIPFVLGHALYMKAIHGGKAKNDRIDSEKIARLLQSKFMPMGYVYPRGMREVRALLRRRMYLVQHRSEMLAHIQCTRQQYNLEPLGRNLGKRCHRLDLCKEFPEGDLRKMAEVDLTVIEHMDPVIRDLETYVERKARIDDPVAINLLRTVPGIGQILALVILYEMHSVDRFPTVGQFCSYARLVKCQSRSAGKVSGTRGSKIGNRYLKWAFNEAALLFLRGNEEAKKYQSKLERKHGKSKAITIIAHRLGIAVYYMLKRREVFDLYAFLGTSKPASKKNSELAMINE
jgi:transposase